jgi:hypothetical protein
LRESKPLCGFDFAEFALRANSWASLGGVWGKAPNSENQNAARFGSPCAFPCSGHSSLKNPHYKVPAVDSTSKKMKHVKVENEREIFLRKVNEFIASAKSNNKKELKSLYLKLVKEYHPDKNNKIDKNILHEYMVLINNTYNEIEKKSERKKLKNKQTNSKYFYINTFCQLLSRIKTYCSTDGKTDDPEFGGNRDSIIKEISKYNQKAGESFSLLLPQKAANGKNNNAYVKGIAVYEQIFNNAYVYTKYYTKKMQETADTYFYEYADGNTKEIKEAVGIITKWLDGLIENML